MAFWGLGHGRWKFDMNKNLDLSTKEEVNMEDIKEVLIGGYKSNPNKVTWVSEITIEKLEQSSVREGNGSRQLNGADKAMEIPCSHLFHGRCIIK